MDKDLLYQYIENKNINYDISEIESLINTYPWFSHLYFFLVKANNNNFKNTLSKTSFYIPDRKKLYYYIKNDDNILLRENKSLLNENKNIIEKFIKEEPKINFKKDYLNDKNFAEYATTENYEIVTETLAKLYISQNKKEEAIKIYKKLIIKYPEKNIYFADQIKLLEQNN
jgi:predicted Zn-dependent protease